MKLEKITTIGAIAAIGISAMASGAAAGTVTEVPQIAPTVNEAYSIIKDALTDDNVDIQPFEAYQVAEGASAC